jgi:hypothetical protein
MGASCCPSPNTRSPEDAADNKTRGELQVDKKDVAVKTDMAVTYGNRESRTYEPDGNRDSRGRVSIEANAGTTDRPPGGNNENVAERIKKRKPTGFVKPDLLKNLDLDEEEEDED